MSNSYIFNYNLAQIFKKYNYEKSYYYADSSINGFGFKGR